MSKKTGLPTYIGLKNHINKNTAKKSSINIKYLAHRHHPL